MSKTLALQAPWSSSPWPEPMAAPGAPGAGAAHRLVFHGRGESLFGMHVVNVFLTLLTLGVYFFWAKARIRRYLFGQTAFQGDRFAFHGTGGEMLLGFVKALLVFGLPLALLNWLPQLLGADASVKIAASVAAYAVVLTVVPIARTGARRYRLSRTSWRGIRFSFRGRTVDYIRLFVAGSLLSAATVGLYYPIFATRSQAFMIRGSRFGDARFDFDGHGRDLMVRFVYAVLLTLPTLGIVWFWFIAAQRRYFWEHTRFMGARFWCGITGPRLLGLKLGNLLVIVLTLGLAWPLATVRTARFNCRHIALVGPLDLGAVRQDATTASATGEGLLGFLDTDVSLG
jgi:uncharacterized membrane protein YjgN (DUF898 family)